MVFLTGRVGEGTDLFTMQNRKVTQATTPASAPKVILEFYELDAVVSLKNIEQDAASIIKQEEEEQQGATAMETATNTTTLSSLLESKHEDGGGRDTEKAREDMQAASGGANTNTVHVKKEMLVVFDRSDPEFESDSDPDDDLDL
jgi:hypothetical protein